MGTHYKHTDNSTMKVWLPILISLLAAVCLGQRRSNRCIRKYGGDCRKSLNEYPCSDPDSLITDNEGPPLCPNKKPHCCIPSPGPKCWSRNGVSGYCGDLSINNTWVDEEDAVQPCSHGGLHIKYGDYKCSKLNKQDCCTHNLPCGNATIGIEAYCGPWKKMSDESKRCVNGLWYEQGDEQCPDNTLCCQSSNPLTVKGY